MDDRIVPGSRFHFLHELPAIWLSISLSGFKISIV